MDEEETKVEGEEIPVEGVEEAPEVANEEEKEAE